MSTREFPKVFDSGSYAGERSREHRHRMSIGGRIRYRITRSSCWRRMIMRPSRMGVRMSIPSALPLTLRSMCFNVVKVVIPVGIPPNFESRCQYPIRILIRIERRIDERERSTTSVPFDGLYQRVGLCSLIDSFEDCVVNRCCRIHFSGSESTVRSACDPNRFLVSVDRLTHRRPLRKRLQLGF